MVALDGDITRPSAPLPPKTNSRVWKIHIGNFQLRLSTRGYFPRAHGAEELGSSSSRVFLFDWSRSAKRAYLEPGDLAEAACLLFYASHVFYRERSQ